MTIAGFDLIPDPPPIFFGPRAVTQDPRDILGVSEFGVRGIFDPSGPLERDIHPLLFAVQLSGSQVCYSNGTIEGCSDGTSPVCLTVKLFDSKSLYAIGCNHDDI